MHEWMRAIKKPTSYRVGNTRFSIKPPIQLIAMSFCATFIIFYLIISFSTKTKDYDSKYSFKKPRFLANGQLEYEIALIADLDTNSKRPDSNEFLSYLLKARLIIDKDFSKARIDMDEPIEISSQYSYGDRGMELSELVFFNNRLLSCDDRTGIIYEINSKNIPIPWIILTDGDGLSSSKGFKCEWMTVKDNLLYVGGLGKEWTTSTGVLVNHNPQWIKIIDHVGFVKHVDWTERYNAIRKKAGYSFPGYMIFESAFWSDIHKKWFFLPRRASKDAYDEKLDEKRATNLLITANHDFTNINVKEIGIFNEIRGYSSFKFIPYTHDQLIVALKTEEDSSRISSYLTVLNLDGSILLKDTIVSTKLKFEGVEFI